MHQLQAVTPHLSDTSNCILCSFSARSDKLNEPSQQGGDEKQTWICSEQDMAVQGLLLFFFLYFFFGGGGGVGDGTALVLHTGEKEEKERKKL